MFFCTRNYHPHDYSHAASTISGFSRFPGGHPPPELVEGQHGGDDKPNMQAHEQNKGQRYYYDPSTPGHQWYYMYRSEKQKLQDARELGEIIGKRNFEGKIMPTSSPLGYSLLLGGATFFALSFPAMMIARPLSRVLGRRAAYGGLKVLTTLTAGCSALKYYQRKQTLEDLKIMGTFLAPNEPSAGADAISRHPLVDRALFLEAQARRSGFNYDAEFRNPYHGGFFFGSMNRQILDEYQNVLAHCEERRKN